MADRSIVTRVTRTCVITLATATMVGTGGSAYAGSNEYPPSASIDPIAPTTTTASGGTTPSGGTSAPTGSDSTRSAILLGIGALGLGGGMVAVSRRRRDTANTT